LCGLSLLEEGTIHWCGNDVAADRYAFHAGLAYQGHDVALKGDLTAVENLRYGVGLRRTVALAEIHSALQLAGLANIDIPVRQLSAGQRRRVALARVELLGVRLWLLDEPTSNLDADGHALVSQMLNQHLAGGGIALIATHQDLGIEPARLKTLELN
jgi:heme exporter protein A